MLDKVYILNIPNEQHRLKYCRQYLLDQDVPEACIEVFEASTPGKFKSAESFCKKAADEGFAYFQKMLEEQTYQDASIGYLAQGKSYLRFWKHLQDTGETALLLHDDTRLLCKWKDLQHALAKLEEPLSVLVLPASLDLDTWDATSPFVHGLPMGSPHDFAIIYTPAGAEMLINNVINPSSGMGWMGASMWNVMKIHSKGVWTLVINPSPDNLDNMVKIKKNVMPGTPAWLEYGCCWGIPELSYDSSLHNPDGNRKE